MKIGIMQPYLFPYPGYFQLIKEVDLFLLHDDAQWIKAGWINRNIISLNGKPFLWTFPVAKGSNYALINQRQFAPLGQAQHKVINKLISAYQGFPFYPDVMPILENTLKSDERIVSSLIHNSICQICSYLNIKTAMDFTSNYTINKKLTGQAKVIELCRASGGSTYINPRGGKLLYDPHLFQKNKLDLKFLKPHNASMTFAAQTNQALSIIHDLMTYCPRTVDKRLSSYELEETNQKFGEKHA